MENKYKELFEKIAPQKSDDELLSAVLDRKAVNMSEKKRFNKKAIIIPAAAAAVLLCTTAGVSAAYEWSLPAALSDIFDRSSKKTPDDVTFKDFNFQTIGGKELNDVLKFDGYEVQFKGISADPHNMILFYDVVMDDPDFKLADNEEMGIGTYVKHDWDFDRDYYLREGAAGTPDDPATLSREEMSKKIGVGLQERNIFLGAEGNVAHFYFKALFEGPSCTGKKVTIEIGNPGKGIKGDYTSGESLFGDSKENLKEYEISFDFVDETGSLDYMTETAITLSTGESGTITHVQVTPLSVCFNIRWGETPVEWKETNENPDPSALDAEQIYNEFKIKLKDGTVMDRSSFLSPEDGARMSLRSHGHRNDDGIMIMEYSQEPAFEWLYPVNVSDIEALIIGTTTVPINQ